MSFKSVFLLVCVVASLILISEAQLTFTSSWGGKRSGSVAGTVNCRNEEAMASIYKLIQGEAEKLLFCLKS